ncbi:ribonuclease P protein subunit p25 [Sorex fumeus]|uniref:ribonuclease P protein subunit p25 n=1 Tax=Sorex fumeus TaxID=62283 RepID=UPI0024AE3C81|nr:ribonuclease P protein subunit p25 [Sorex fumeus]
MENFRKVRSEEAPAGGAAEGGGAGAGPFADLAPGAVHMRVKEGSKIRNLLAFAAASMAQPATRAIVFSGCGRATTKAVTCAEILKRRLAGLHQVTRLRYRSVREEWQRPGPEPAAPAASLSVLKNVPSLAILLSKDALDPRQPGYQPPGPQPAPSAPPAARRSPGEPPAGQGPAKRARPEPGAAEGGPRA